MSARCPQFQTDPQRGEHGRKSEFCFWSALCLPTTRTDNYYLHCGDQLTALISLLFGAVGGDERSELKVDYLDDVFLVIVVAVEGELALPVAVGMVADPSSTARMPRVGFGCTQRTGNALWFSALSDGLTTLP